MPGIRVLIQLPEKNQCKKKEEKNKLREGTSYQKQLLEMNRHLRLQLQPLLLHRQVKQKPLGDFTRTLSAQSFCETDADRARKCSGQQ